MQDRIIKLFYDDVYAQFTINEIAKKINISYSYVYRQVEELKDREILVIEQLATAALAAIGVKVQSHESLIKTSA